VALVHKSKLGQGATTVSNMDAPGCQAFSSRYCLPLLASVGRAVKHAGKTTLYLKPMHAAKDNLLALIANFHASCPMSLADSINVMSTAARSPARWLPTKSQFLRPCAKALQRGGLVPAGRSNAASVP
jgi:hypothetical protein